MSGNSKKQAIVVIHGMGEQKPMGTLRSFVKTIWRKDPVIAQGNCDNPAWIKPDARAGLQELRRITTGKNAAGVRSDFYEFYWADLMQGTTWQHLMSWIRGLLLRSPVTVPWDVFMIWLILWLIAIGAVFLSLSSVPDLTGTIAEAVCEMGGESRLCQFSRSADQFLNSTEKLLAPYKLPALMAISTMGVLIVFPWQSLRHLRTWLTMPLLALIVATIYVAAVVVERTNMSGFIIALAGLALLNTFLVPYFGDVARYVQAKPENVERRKAVRDRGLALFHNLHDCEDYDRIIVVSHSLGTMVAYDVLAILWTEYGPSQTNPPTARAREEISSLDKWIEKQRASAEGLDVDAFQQRQRLLSRELARCPDPPEPARPENQTPPRHKPWLISDFITLGSPLTHAEFLLADDPKGLRELIGERVLPSCPPVTESNRKRNRRSFQYKNPADGAYYPHHAALFSAVRWTNICDPHNWFGFLFGDPISGPVSANFGDGIKDIKVRIPKGSGGIPRFFTHTKYWQWLDEWDGDDAGLPSHITHLRHAVDLIDRDKSSTEKKPAC